MLYKGELFDPNTPNNKVGHNYNYKKDEKLLHKQDEKLDVNCLIHVNFFGCK